MVTYACVLIRKLKKPNKFGENYRMDFHRYRDGKILECIMTYEIESVERAYWMLRGDTWVKEKFDIAKIIELAEDEVIPGQEKPVLETLKPVHGVYQLDRKPFEVYLNTWLKKEKNIEVTVGFHGENGGGYGLLWFDIEDEQDQAVLSALYGMEGDREHLEFELVEPILHEVFESENITYEYDWQKDCLMVYKSIN